MLQRQTAELRATLEGQSCWVPASAQPSTLSLLGGLPGTPELSAALPLGEELQVSIPRACSPFMAPRTCLWCVPAQGPWHSGFWVRAALWHLPHYLYFLSSMNHLRVAGRTQTAFTAPAVLEEVVNPDLSLLESWASLQTCRFFLGTTVVTRSGDWYHVGAALPDPWISLAAAVVLLVLQDYNTRTAIRVSFRPFPSSLGSQALLALLLVAQLFPVILKSTG